MNENFKRPITSILVVDDEDGVRRLLGETLHALGYITYSSSNISEAWQIFMREKIDLVITDYYMPEGTGAELLIRIKKEKPNIPAIVITGYAGSTTIEDFQEMGADGFLSKPFRIGIVEELISSTLNKYNDSSKETTKSDKHQILVVDDDDSVRQVLQETLRSFGFSVIAANDARSAMNFIENHEFDLVISDYMLSDSNGVELIGKIKNLRPAIPSVIITGYSNSYTQEMATTDGINGYLVKPFRINQVKTIVQQLLALDNR